MDMGIRYSFPASFSKDDLLELKKITDMMDSTTVNPHEDCIDNIYGSFPRSVLGHARSPATVPKIDDSTFKDYVQGVRKLGIDFHFTLNNIWANGRERDPANQPLIKRYIEHLIDSGVSGLIIANAYLMKLVREWFGNVKIIASINLKIDSDFLVKRYLELGADSIVLDREIYRNIPLLKSLFQKYPERFVLLANSTCLLGCPLQTYHSLENGFLSMETDQTGDIDADYHDRTSRAIISENFCFEYCVEQYTRDPALLLKTPWIRPEDIPKYSQIGANHFKIQGRTMSIVSQVELLNAYMLRRTPGDDLFFIWPKFKKVLENHLVKNAIDDGGSKLSISNTILNESHFIEHFFRKEDDCRKGCHACKFCDDVYRKMQVKRVMK